MSVFVGAPRPDGTIMNLADPQVSDIVWSEIANSLSKIARFNGRYSCPAYSVAQHCVMGADALFNETSDAIRAGYFLMHDAHEVMTGDIIRPMVTLLDLRIGPLSVRDCIEEIKHEMDAVIFKAAKLPPIDQLPLLHRAVKKMDEQMLRAEALAFFGRNAADALTSANLRAPKLTGVLKPWGPMKAEEAWLNRLDRYLGIKARTAA